MLERERAIERLRPWVQRASVFEGWSFDALNARSLGPACPWDYASVVAEHAALAGATLDLGTGGGEVLASLRPSLGERVVATEEWPVNMPVARGRLAPLGVAVVRADSERPLPFADESFDLVINRHSGFDPVEVSRVLTPGGWFVTQQVRSDNWPELRARLPMTDFSDVHAAQQGGLHAAGLEVVRDESHYEQVAYPSLGEVVYLLQVTHSWELPDFTVERYVDELLAIERECTGSQGLVITEARQLLVARKSTP